MTLQAMPETRISEGIQHAVIAACGRNRMVNTSILRAVEWLLSGKADVSYWASETHLAECRLSAAKLSFGELGRKCLLLTQSETCKIRPCLADTSQVVTDIVQVL